MFSCIMPAAGTTTHAVGRNALALFATRERSNFAITEAALKILYISQYFPPEMGAPAARVSELSRHWTQAGHQVTVLTGFPNHPDGVVRPEYRKPFRQLVFREAVDRVTRRCGRWRFQLIVAPGTREDCGFSISQSESDCSCHSCFP